MGMNTVNHYKDSDGKPQPGSSLGTLISGEDQDNDVTIVEERYGYEVVDWGAISADEILGTTGAVGDVLRRITITEQTAGATLNVYDGTVAAGTLILSIAAGGTVGTTYELGIISANGGFTIDYDASATDGILVCVGRFT